MLETEISRNSTKLGNFFQISFHIQFYSRCIYSFRSLNFSLISKLTGQTNSLRKQRKITPSNIFSRYKREILSTINSKADEKLS